MLNLQSPKNLNPCTQVPQKVQTLTLRRPLHPTKNPEPETPNTTVNSRKWEHGLRMVRAGIPFSKSFGVWGEGCSNFLEFTVSRKSECPLVGVSLRVRRRGP